MHPPDFATIQVDFAPSDPMMNEIEGGLDVGKCLLGDLGDNRMNASATDETLSQRYMRRPCWESL